MRRILKEFTLTKIAAVDKPCVEGATVTIMKRADPSITGDHTMSHIDELEKKLDSLEREISKAANNSQGFDDGDEYDDQMDDMSDDGDDDDDDDDGNSGRYQKSYAQNSSSGSPLGQTHKFETVTQRIAAERDLPLAEAAVAARKENPVLFANYQQSGLVGNAAASHQALVTAAMSKGHSEIVAQRQALHALGSPPWGLEKRDDSTVRFMDLVTKVMERDGLQRTDAMRKVRLAHPALAKRFAEV